MRVQDISLSVTQPRTFFSAHPAAALSARRRLTSWTLEHPYNLPTVAAWSKLAYSCTRPSGLGLHARHSGDHSTNVSRFVIQTQWVKYAQRLRLNLRIRREIPRCSSLQHRKDNKIAPDVSSNLSFMSHHVLGSQPEPCLFPLVA